VSVPRFHPQHVCNPPLKVGQSGDTVNDVGFEVTRNREAADPFVQKPNLRKQYRLARGGLHSLPSRPIIQHLRPRVCDPARSPWLKRLVHFICRALYQVSEAAVFWLTIP